MFLSASIQLATAAVLPWLLSKDRKQPWAKRSRRTASSAGAAMQICSAENGRERNFPRARHDALLLRARGARRQRASRPSARGGAGGKPRASLHRSPSPLAWLGGPCWQRGRPLGELRNRRVVSLGTSEAVFCSDGGPPSIRRATPGCPNGRPPRDERACRRLARQAKIVFLLSRGSPTAPGNNRKTVYIESTAGNSSSLWHWNCHEGNHHIPTYNYERILQIGMQMKHVAP
mmetsp:Transcript_79049/g.212320  ORF Transcript_79049/g.212320 Transcript_79049/m.212320 type:complete len:232 (-) Transcript_79049:24-719(-)